MTHISKKWIEPEIWKYINESLTNLVKDIENRKESDLFLKSVLTDTERLMISKRIVTAFYLRHNITVEQICETLKLTRETVKRQILWIQTHKEGFEMIFSKMEKQRKENATRELFYKLLDYAIVTGSGQVPKMFNQGGKFSKKSPFPM